MIFPMFEGVMFISAPGTLDNLDNLDSSTTAFFLGSAVGLNITPRYTKVYATHDCGPHRSCDNCPKTLQDLCRSLRSNKTFLG